MRLLTDCLIHGFKGFGTETIHPLPLIVGYNRRRHLSLMRLCVVQLTDLSSTSGRSYGYTGGYRSNYDAASRTFGGSAGSSGAGASADRTLGYISAYGGVSSLKEKFDVGGRRAPANTGYTSSLDRYSNRSGDYGAGRLGSGYSSDYDLSRPSGGSSKSYGRTSSYTPSVGRASSPVWSGNRSSKPDYRYRCNASLELSCLFYLSSSWRLGTGIS